MNILIDGITHKLTKTTDTDNYIEYTVYRNTTLLGHITKSGAEVLYTARDTDYNIIATGSTLRDALESMILNIFYSNSFKGDQYIHTLGAWIEGAEVQVEYVKNNIVKHSKRVVRYNRQAGDLYIVLNNNKYFYHEFN